MTAPSVGPTAPAAAPIAPQMATATGRRSRGKARMTRASDAGMTAAAPTAWITRNPFEHGDRRGDGARRRPEGEERGAEEEDPLVAEPVGELAGRDEQGGEGDRVAVEHPGQRRRRWRPENDALMSGKATNSTVVSRNVISTAMPATASVRWAWRASAASAATEVPGAVLNGGAR